MIAATGSGRGKTTFTTALLMLLKDKGVHAFKCGPDYIDPMFHKSVLGIPSTNLDSFFCDENLLKKVLIDNSGDINIIEAAMGLYDGIGASKKASAYEIASYIDCPIILLIDGYGMGYSLIAEIKGFLSMDENKLIKGVVLNRVSEKYYKKIAPVIEKETGVKLLGFLPKIKGAEIKSRHLGLMSPDENNFDEKLNMICEEMERSVNLEGIISIANNGCFHTEDDENKNDDKNKNHDNEINLESVTEKLSVSVAKDEAFSFIYEENIKFLRKLGCEVTYFSPIHDKEIPNGSDVVILYGGYPENYAKELSANKDMVCSLRYFYEDGKKIIAECGGFMYLLDAICVDGCNHDMAGIIRGNAYRTKGLVRFGYVNIKENDLTIKGHEFHHFEVGGTEYSDSMMVENASSGENYKGMIYTEKLLAGFPHLYYLSCPELIRRFLFT